MKAALEFKDISTEQYREYLFPDMTIVIDAPEKLNVSASGGHRIVDVTGQSHYIPPGWRRLSWRVKPGAPEFSF